MLRCPGHAARRCLPEEQRSAAAEALRALRRSCQLAQGAGGLGRSSSVPKRKRSHPPRATSAKSLKAENEAAAAV